MLNCREDFALTVGQHWLNTASEGPLPLVSTQALNEAIFWKQSPERLTISKFQSIPLTLKQSLAKLLNANYQDIILGNSATYGLHLLANGLSFKSGDEILLMQNDFPTDILPWLSLTNKGVNVRQLSTQGHVLSVDEVKNALNKNTKLICIPHIHSFTGLSLDINAIGNLCQQQGIIVVINVAQSAGIMPLDVNDIPADVIVGAGYKWLLGPYGTGFAWIKPNLLAQLDYPQNYWISLMNEKMLTSTDALELPNDRSSRRYDVFGTANFFNFVPWRASIDYLLSKGINAIMAHNKQLNQRFTDELDSTQYTIITSPTFSPIIVFSSIDQNKNNHIHQHLTSQGYHLALWKNRLRLSPHLFNTAEDIEGLLTVLHEII